MAAQVTVHRLTRVRSLRWSAGALDGLGADRQRRGVVIAGDDWQVTVAAANSAEHLPYLSRLLHLT